MSSITHTVLISSSGAGGPWADRVRKPISVASLWAADSAKWVFTSLLSDGAGGSVRPFGQDDEADALLVGIAVHLVRDEDVCALWKERADAEGHQSDLSRKMDEALVMAARKVVVGACRLSIIHEGNASDDGGLTKTLAQLEGLDLEVLVPGE